MPSTTLADDLVGVVPLAGHAVRLQPLPFSKELFPVGLDTLPGTAGLRPIPVCLHLLRQLRHAGVRRACLVLRPGKWDIPAYLQDGAIVGLSLSYQIMPQGYGVPFTVDAALPFVGANRVAFGFADILLAPGDVFQRLAARQAERAADVVLAAYATEQPMHWGMIGIDRQATVYRVVEKPKETDLRLAWTSAVWAPTFSRFLGQYVSCRREAMRAAWDAGERSEVTLAEVFQAAIDAGLRIEAEIVRDGSAVDIGRPEVLHSLFGGSLGEPRGER